MAEPQPEGEERGQGQAAIVLVVTERPERFSELQVPGRAVRLWGAPGGGGGDPADPASYRSVENCGRPLTAVVDLGESGAAADVLRALEQGFPDAAALVLCRGERPLLPDGVVYRCVPPNALFSRELSSELEELESARRARLLARFAEGAETLPILVQRDPDPDALASALAVRALLQRLPAEAPIISLGELTRPENRRMADLLAIAVSTVGEGELRACERVITVDVQPPPRTGAPGPRWAVIDHHPPEGDYDAEFLDIRPELGATATMLTEYLRAQDERRLGERLATALLYGIRTDTAMLTRGVTGADAAAYVFLQQRADAEL
ncbi:MAG TPA: DHH family phosphoesterase, partial [Longimicrobiales bacterium]|nr:DHH family phosphoesterase [Longimicrobiales bacterium]